MAYKAKTLQQRSGKRFDPRPTSDKRGYSADWAHMSKCYRAVNPLCERCEREGRTTPAELVHHRQPVKARPDLRLSWENLEALCRPCHGLEHAHDGVPAKLPAKLKGEGQGRGGMEGGRGQNPMRAGLGNTAPQPFTQFREIGPRGVTTP